MRPLNTKCTSKVTIRNAIITGVQKTSEESDLPKVDSRGSTQVDFSGEREDVESLKSLLILMHGLMRMSGSMSVLQVAQSLSILVMIPRDGRTVFTYSIL